MYVFKISVCGNDGKWVNQERQGFLCQYASQPVRKSANQPQPNIKDIKNMLYYNELCDVMYYLKYTTIVKVYQIFSAQDFVILYCLKHKFIETID